MIEVKKTGACLYTTWIARQHNYGMLSALYAIARPSDRLSVRHKGGSVKNGWS